MNIIKLELGVFSSFSFNIFFSCFLFITASTCSARSLFELDVSIPGENTSRGFSDVEDLVNQLNNGGLDNLLVGYVNDVTATNAQMNIRGVPAIGTYALNSSVLVFQVPATGINVSFSGVDRDDSQDMFFDWLKGAGNSFLTDLLQELVATTPVDPVAGNPNSLMSTMANADFYATGSTSSFNSEDDTETLPNLLSFGGGHSYTSSGGFKTHIASLPINYIVPLMNEKGLSVIVDAPLTYLNIAGGHAFHGSLGLGLRIPVWRLNNVDWSLTPIGRAGFTGSKNLGSTALIYSGSLTSSINLTFDTSDLAVSINNMIGYYQTDSLGIGDFKIDYDLENVVFKNGVGVEGTLGWAWFDKPTTWEVTFVDTQFIGSNLFLDHYDEVSLSFGTRRVTNQMSWQSLRIGLGYTFGNKYDAYKFTMNYQF